MCRGGGIPAGKAECGRDALGVGGGREASLSVHCIHELLYVRGQQFIHLVALDSTGRGQSCGGGESPEAAAELKEGRKPPSRWALPLLALVGLSPTLSLEGAGTARSRLRVFGHERGLPASGTHLTPDRPWPA